jgi:hypothetical protein
MADSIFSALVLLSVLAVLTVEIIYKCKNKPFPDWLNNWTWFNLGVVVAQLCTRLFT